VVAPQQGTFMNLCEFHGNRLQSLLDEKGQTSQLSTCNTLIASKALKLLGFVVLHNPKEPKCPICEALKHHEDSWIRGTVETVLKDSKRDEGTYENQEQEIL
jgi:hypothetical protein